MLKAADREAKAVRWLAHLRAWSASGGPLAAYARAHELPEWEAYRWMRILRRDGRWTAPSDEATRPRPTFVRVKAAAAPPARASMNAANARFEERITLTVTLARGRRVELTVASVAAVLEVLSALECAA